jgi:GR25 family glycosyltransferase involved in LPS biosynthesis
MKSILHNHFDKIFCINLVNHPEKKEFMQNKFDKYEIEVEWFHPVIPGYSSKIIEAYTNHYNNTSSNQIFFNRQFPNELGAFQSHYHVIKTALYKGYENIFVFEDDCSFHTDWEKLLPKYLDTIPPDADSILLYSYMHQLEKQNIRIRPRWTKGFASWSLIAYSMNKRAMEEYIKIQDNQPMIADKASWIMMTQKNFNFYIASPPLVTPSKKFSSDIRGNNKNYEKNKSIFLLGVNEDNYK